MSNYYKNQFEASKRITKKEKRSEYFWIITTVLFFALMIAGLVVTLVTQSIWPMLAGCVGFVAFVVIAMFAVSVKQKVASKKIENSLDWVIVEAKVVGVQVVSQTFAFGELMELTLSVDCVVDDTITRGWYKLRKNELKTIQRAPVFVGSYHQSSFTVSLKSLNRFLGAGDIIFIKYVPHTPKNCIILGKEIEDRGQL